MRDWPPLCNFLFRYNNFLFWLNPFNACAEFFRYKAYRRIGAIILNKCGRIKLAFLAVYISNVRADINQNCYVLTCFKILPFDCHKFPSQAITTISSSGSRLVINSMDYSCYVKLYIKTVLESNRLCKVYLIFIGI